MGQELGLLVCEGTSTGNWFWGDLLEDQLLIFGGINSKDEVIVLDVEKQSLK